jgi:uncharacterized membrane protein YadS
VLGFAGMSLLRTIGDLGATPFGILEPAQWSAVVEIARHAAELCLAVAMAAVGLGTRFRDFAAIGPRPFAVGLFSALLVGVVSFLLVSALY